MNTHSKPCEYANFSNLKKLPCDWSECSLDDTNCRIFCCKACGKVNRIDIETASNPSSTGLGTLVMIVGTLLIVIGLLITNQPQSPSVHPSERNFLEN